jgi:hypothetical protein
MRYAAGSAPFRSFLVGALLLAPAATTRAGDDAVDEAFPRHLERQVLMSVEYPYGTPESFLDRFHLSKKRGVEYRQVISLDDRKFAFTLYGPVVKKKPGLGFRLTGKIGKHNVLLKGYGNVKRLGFRLTGKIGKHNVLLKGYGNVKKQGFTIRVDF